MFTLASLYKFTSVYTCIRSCRRDESKTSFPLQERILFYAKFLLVITHRNTLQTKKKDSNVSVFYHHEVDR